MSDNEDDPIYRRSPGLEPIKTRLTPPPPSEPFLPRRKNESSEEDLDSQAKGESRAPGNKRKKAKRRGNQGDVVLLNYLDPNRPEISIAAGQSPLHSRSSSASRGDLNSEGMHASAEGPLVAAPVTYPSRYDFTHLSYHTNGGRLADYHLPTTITHHPHLQQHHHVLTHQSMNQCAGRSMTNDHDHFHSAATLAVLRENPRYMENSVTNRRRSSSSPAGSASRSQEQLQIRQQAAAGLVDLKNVNPLKRTYMQDDTLATSPKLQPHIIRPTERSPESLLPAFEGKPALKEFPFSHNLDNNHLPSVKGILEAAEQSDSFRGHSRARTSSYSSVNSAPPLSPSYHRRLPLTSSRSPQRPIPALPSSPLVLRSESTPFDSNFSPLSVKSVPYWSNNDLVASPRNSIVHANTWSQPLPSVSPNSTTSPATSIGDNDGENSIDGRTSSISRSRNNSLITNSANGQFVCKEPGCTAQPFTTQYLLNSHANVHSNDRPHYCSVLGCARSVLGTNGRGGRGFKRKNEMIRHGLVHNSPGYVCPFCEDREHRYPRPDNLQRHVRMHHEDKDKDDPVLRGVLSQRPQGGMTRGRRRRG